MSVKQTTQLTAFWGVGTLVAILLSGLVLLKYFGHIRVFRGGLLIVIAALLGIVVAGAFENVAMLQLMVVLLGFGTGISAASLLVQMIEFTTPARAGLLVGIWGVAHQLGRALASLTGGSVADIMLFLSGGNALFAYGSVFLLAAGLLVVAMVLIGRFDIEASEVWKREQADRNNLSADPAS